MLFFYFRLHFSKIQMTIVKNLTEKLPFLQWISKVLMKFYLIRNIFDLQIFDNETTAL